MTKLHSYVLNTIAQMHFIMSYLIVILQLFSNYINHVNVVDAEIILRFQPAGLVCPVRYHDLTGNHRVIVNRV